MRSIRVRCCRVLGMGITRAEGGLFGHVSNQVHDEMPFIRQNRRFPVFRLKNGRDEIQQIHRSLSHRSGGRTGGPMRRVVRYPHPNRKKF